MPTEFTFTPMTTAFAHQIATWRYPPPYDVYNPSPDDIEMVFLNPDFHYHALLNASGDLIAYRCFGPDAQVPGGDYSPPALDLGGGLHPNQTGQGLGPLVMQAAMAFARQNFNPPAFRVTVAGWNTRALRACLKVGYLPTATFQSTAGVDFVMLMRSAS